ncbi:hypothetical protein IIC65_07510 [Candidatus Sumerlaeota bacterium]|nr:hypothetical protein [Candidatus Sumerlaeota bacterium]
MSISEGYYQDQKIKCRMCGGQWMKAEEKMTDVNIAVEMLQDAHLDAFDDAIIVSR